MTVDLDLERLPGLSSVEIEAVKSGVWPHLLECYEELWRCEVCSGDLKEIRRVIASVQPLVEQEHLEDLEAAGRLLPEGSKVVTEYRVVWTPANPSSNPLVWGFPLLERARARAADHWPVGFVSGEISRQDRWESPWVPVGPVAAEGREP